MVRLKYIDSGGDVSVFLRYVNHNQNPGRTGSPNGHQRQQNKDLFNG